MRTANRVVSALLALALLAGGLIVFAEIVAAAFDRGPLVLPYDDWYRWGRETSWEDADLRLLAIALVAAGVVLLVLEAARRSPAAIPLTEREHGVATELDRGGLERWLASRAEGVDGVSSAKARVRRRGATVLAEAVQRDTRAVELEVRQSVGEAVEDLGLASPLPLKVDVRTRRQS